MLATGDSGRVVLEGGIIVMVRQASGHRRGGVGLIYVSVWEFQHVVLELAIFLDYWLNR